MPLQHEHGEWTNENKTDENKNEQETEILATNSKKSKEYFKIEFYKEDNHWMGLLYLVQTYFNSANMMNSRDCNH